MNVSRRRSVVTALLLGLMPAPLIAATTAFTYQGQLKDTGAPANGRYDLAFSLWDDPTSTDSRDQIGGTLEFLGQPVSDGLFEVALDFRDGAFPGEARYLQIEVRPAGGHAYTTLSPRQELTPTPYAMTAQKTIGVDGYSLDAVDGSVRDVVYVDERGNVGVGTTTPRAALDVAGTVASTGLKLTTAPSDGFVLTSDASGNASWAAPPSGGSGYWQNGPEDHIFFNDGYVGIGTGSTQTPAQALHVEGSAYVSDRVGIGTISPAAPLDVVGRISSDGFQLRSGATAGYVLTTDASGVGTWRAPAGGGTGFWSDGPEDNIYYNDGSVGIGTGGAETPLQMLHVAGSAYFRDFVGIGTATPTSPLQVVGTDTGAIVGVTSFDSGRGVYGEATGSSGYGVSGVAASGIGVIGESNTNSGGTGVWGWVESSTGVGVAGFNDAESGDAIAVKGVSASASGFAGYFDGQGYFSNNVGIGTTTPEHKLHVVGGTETAMFGSTNVSATPAVKGLNLNTTGRGVMGEVVGTNGYGVYGKAVGGAGVYGTVTTNSGGNGVEGYVESATGHAIYGYNEATSGDAVGVYGESASPAGYGGYFYGKGYFRNNLGVGIEPATAAMLHVENARAGAGEHAISASITNPSTSSDAAAGSFSAEGTPGMAVYAMGDGGNAVHATQVGSVGHAVWAHNDNAHAAVVATNGGTGDLFEGRVGTDAVFRVAKTGITHVKVLAVEGGADLAERFDVGEGARPGIVVEIDPDHLGKLRIAKEAYSRRVAGVISGANGLDAGMILGDLAGGAKSQPVALSGRVWVYCDATDHPIHPGDLLTTSNRPGHAMAVSDYARAHGAVLGKAMSTLEEGTGLVVVLVSLQ